MATELPTVNVVTVTSSATLSGNKDVEIVMKFRDRTSSPSTQSLTGTLSNIGNVRIEIDEQEDTDELTDFVYNVAEFSFSMFSTFGDGSSFGVFLNALTFNDLIQIELKYDDTGSGSLPSNPDIFLAKKLDVSYNELKREFSIKGFSAMKFVNAITPYNPDNDEVTLNFGSDTYKGVTAKDLIKNYINTLSASTTAKIQSSFTKVKSDADGLGNGVTGVFHMFVTDINGTLILTDSTISGGLNQFAATTLEQARSAALKLGVIESAIIGSLFGENFYVRRDYTGSASGYSSTITGSDLEELKIKFFGANIQKITLSGNNIGTSDTTSLLSTIDGTATKTLDLAIGAFANTQTLTGNDSFPINVDVSNPSGRYRESTSGNQLGASLNIGSDAMDIYKKVLAATNTVKFEFVVLGTEKLKPYYYATLDHTMSDFIVQNGNDKVRPSSLEYDLKNNKIRVEAYSIN